MRLAGYWTLATLLLAQTAAAQLGSQARYVRLIEPRPLRLQIIDMSVGMYSEAVYEETSVLKSGQSTTYQRVFIGPDIGLSMAGSVYHPNLFQFHLSGDAAYGWSQQIIESNGASEHRERWEVLGNYRGSAELLPDKPLNGSLHSRYGRSYREYDFFTRSTVETFGYGSRLHYHNEATPVSIVYDHLEDKTLDTSSAFSSIQDVISLNAVNQRARGSSTLNYTVNQYEFSGGSETLNHTVTLADTEELGSRGQYGLATAITANRHEIDDQLEDQLSARAGLSIEHAPHLISSYGANYDYFEAADFTSQSYQGSAGLQHRLYESIYSSLFANASESRSETDEISGFTRQFGAGWAEGYTKRLGEEHRLQLNAALFVNHTDQQSTGRAVNERHAFPSPPAAEAFFLTLPNVIESTIVVTDTTQSRTFRLGIDYEIFQNGTITEIRRIVGVPDGIPEGATVLVDYQATPTGAAGYETFSESAGIRLSLWRNLWGIYARASHNSNNAPRELHVIDSTSYVLGSDVTWDWLRAGAEYFIYDSTESSYWSVRLFQTAAFRLNPVSSLSIGFGEAYTAYVEAERHQEDYRFTTTYRRTLAHNLRADLLAGVGLRRGDAIEQTIAVFRPTLDYTIGRTEIQLAYDFEYNLYNDIEERHKHSVMLRVKREF